MMLECPQASVALHAKHTTNTTNHEHHGKAVFVRARARRAVRAISPTAAEAARLSTTGPYRLGRQPMRERERGACACGMSNGERVGRARLPLPSIQKAQAASQPPDGAFGAFGSRRPRRSCDALRQRRTIRRERERERERERRETQTLIQIKLIWASKSF
jgi:hypothetical protein